jgi:hypothetical protein
VEQTETVKLLVVVLAAMEALLLWLQRTLLVEQVGIPMELMELFMDVLLIQLAVNAHYWVEQVEQVEDRQVLAATVVAVVVMRDVVLWAAAAAAVIVAVDLVEKW